MEEYDDKCGNICGEFIRVILAAVHISPKATLSVTSSLQSLPVYKYNIPMHSWRFLKFSLTFPSLTHFQPFTSLSPATPGKIGFILRKGKTPMQIICLFSIWKIKLQSGSPHLQLYTRFSAATCNWSLGSGFRELKKICGVTFSPQTAINSVSHMEMISRPGLCVTDYINFCVESITPTRTVRYPSNKSWITSHLKKDLNLKKKAFKMEDRELLRTAPEQLKN